MGADGKFVSSESSKNNFDNIWNEPFQIISLIQLAFVKPSIGMHRWQGSIYNQIVEKIHFNFHFCTFCTTFVLVAFAEKFWKQNK